MEEDLKKPNDNQNETKTKPRESFIFYRSFYEAIKDLDCETKVEIYDAICEYSLNQNETEIDGIGKTIITLIKPLLDANFKRYKNGCSGGRPKTKIKPKQNQNETKPEPNDNDNVNDNVLNIGTDSNTSTESLTDSITDLKDLKKENKKEKSNSQSVSAVPLYEPKKFNPSVKITEDFHIDFENDETFKPYANAGPELRQALDNWLIKNKLNQMITKDFIARQIVKFAKNLGKLYELAGENINEKTKD